MYYANNSQEYACKKHCYLLLVSLYTSYTEYSANVGDATRMDSIHNRHTSLVEYLVGISLAWVFTIAL